MREVIKFLLIILTALFSVACGLLLVQVLIPLYFMLFWPIPKSLLIFYIVIGIVCLLLLILGVIVFKKGKYNWGILTLVIVILCFGFGIPIFVLQNNEMLWQVAVFSKPGPVYFIEFSDQELSILKSIHNLYQVIWGNLRFYIFAYIVVYVAGYLYLVTRGWRIGGIRIK